MIEMPLRIFTQSKTFPFYIHYGQHEDDDCFIHGHTDFSELVIVLDGVADHVVGAVSYPVTKGEVFVINNGTVHGYRNARNFKICNIMFQPHNMFSPTSDIRQSMGFQALFVVAPHYLQNNQFHSRLTLSLDDFAFVRRLLDEMLVEFQQKHEGWQTLLSAMFIQLCILLSRHYRADQNEHHSDVFKLSRTIAYIEKHYAEDIALADLVQTSGYSERQLTRLFHRTFAASPKQYITKLRIQKAQQLLPDPSHSIGEVAWSCGFADQNYFSRVFRSETGETPSAYRHRRKGKSPE